MICPNCGREISDNSAKCPSCYAAIHAYKRQRSEADLPEDQQVRVRRRVQPVPAQQKADSEQARDYTEARADAARSRERMERRTGQSRETSASERDGSGQHREPASQRNGRREFDPGAQSQYNIPKGVWKSQTVNNGNVRYVRHPGNPQGKRIQAQPAIKHPPLVRKTHKRLFLVGRLIILVLFFMFAYGAYILTQTEDGQQMMAEWGWSIARTDAYVTLGRQLMEQAFYEQAVEKLKVALEREPRNVDALLYMAQTYMKLGREDDAIKIYESLITEVAPQHPSAYRNLISIYQNRGYYSEALALMKRASANTLESTQEFDIMIRAYTPVTPAFSHPEGRYNEEIDVTISIPQGEIVYYTTDGTDPSESGMIYEAGTKIHLYEGKMTIKAIGFTENGMPSEQISANYTVIIPTPAAPKANYKSGVYKNAPKVSLRPGDEDPKKNREIVAIYYTLDGRQATTESTLYDDNNPIQIPVGDSVLRAISVDKKGKVSYEMKVTYKVEGNLKRMFTNENDSFKNLSLFKTTYKTFTKNWGTPLSYEVLPEDRWYDANMETYEAEFEWGLAWFAVKTGGSDPVLVMLDTETTKMIGPRSTKVGMRGVDVMEKFRDLGHPALDDDGNRLLYNWNSANVQFGTFRREADGQYAIHYYDPVDEKQTIFVELSYYLDPDGTVSRIVWRRYLAARR